MSNSEVHDFINVRVKTENHAYFTTVSVKNVVQALIRAGVSAQDRSTIADSYRFLSGPIEYLEKVGSNPVPPHILPLIELINHAAKEFNIPAPARYNALTSLNVQRFRPLTRREKDELPVRAVADSVPIIQEFISASDDLLNGPPPTCKEAVQLYFSMALSAEAIRQGLISDYSFDPNTMTFSKDQTLKMIQFSHLVVMTGQWAEYFFAADVLMDALKENLSDTDAAGALAVSRFREYWKNEAMAINLKVSLDMWRVMGVPGHDNLVASMAAAWASAAGGGISRTSGDATREVYSRALERLTDCVSAEDLCGLPAKIGYSIEKDATTEADKSLKRQRDRRRRSYQKTVNDTCAVGTHELSDEKQSGNPPLPGLADINLLASSEPDPLQRIIAGEELQALLATHEKLTVRERQVLDLKLQGFAEHEKGYTESEIAEKLGVEIGTVKTLWSRARKKLRGGGAK